MGSCRLAAGCTDPKLEHARFYNDTANHREWIYGSCEDGYSGNIQARCNNGVWDYGNSSCGQNCSNPEHDEHISITMMLQLIMEVIHLVTVNRKDIQGKWKPVVIMEHLHI